MDYNLKKENRRKFQDKSKLKRRHKHDYSKVVREEHTVEEKGLERVREYDDKGNPILYDDEELDLNGNITTKGSTNDFRYKEQLIEIEGLEDKYDVDFTKVVHDGEICGKMKDPRRMSAKELSELKIIDHNFTRQIDEKPKELKFIPCTTSVPKNNNKTPHHLKKDEEFLDNLI